MCFEQISATRSIRQVYTSQVFLPYFDVLFDLQCHWTEACNLHVCVSCIYVWTEHICGCVPLGTSLIKIVDLRWLGQWCFKGTDESLARVDLSVFWGTSHWFQKEWALYVLTLCLHECYSIQHSWYQSSQDLYPSWDAYSSLLKVTGDIYCTIMHKIVIRQTYCISSCPHMSTFLLPHCCCFSMLLTTCWNFSLTGQTQIYWDRCIVLVIL